MGNSFTRIGPGADVEDSDYALWSFNEGLPSRILESPATQGGDVAKKLDDRKVGEEKEAGDQAPRRPAPAKSIDSGSANSVLVLGCENSGKTTVVKCLRHAFTEFMHDPAMHEDYLAKIRQEIMASMTDLAKLSFEIGFVWDNLEQLQVAKRCSEGQLTPSQFHQLCTLVHSRRFQELRSLQRSTGKIHPSSWAYQDYFLSNIDRFASTSHTVTLRDVMSYYDSAEDETRGATRWRISVPVDAASSKTGASKRIELVDLRGNVRQRMRWYRCLGNPLVLIYCVSLSNIGKPLEESIAVFDTLLESMGHLRRVPIQLVFTSADVLQRNMLQYAETGTRKSAAIEEVEMLEFREAVKEITTKFGDILSDKGVKSTLRPLVLDMISNLGHETKSPIVLMKRRLLKALALTSGHHRHR